MSPISLFERSMLSTASPALQHGVVPVGHPLRLEHEGLQPSPPRARRPVSGLCQVAERARGGVPVLRLLAQSVRECHAMALQIWS